MGNALDLLITRWALTRLTQDALMLRLMKEQDEELGLLSEHVGAVKNIAITINTELDEQNRILADVDSETEAVQSRMRRVGQR